MRNVPTGPLSGSTIGDAFLLEELLGEGAMGSVYKATQLALQRTVAVKVVGGDFGKQEGSLRLRDEAVAAAKVKHPHVAAVLQRGIDPVLGAYIAYEYLAGETLRSYLDRTMPLDFVTVWQTFGETLCSGLEALHDVGIVHRDVKPSNLIADEHGVFKLTDLGLAMFEGRQARTKTGTFYASVGYVAPERIGNNARPTPSCDLYAVAVMVVEAMTGSLPFKGSSPLEILDCQRTHSPSPEDLIAQGISRERATVLSRTLSIDPNTRPASVAAFRRELLATHGKQPKEKVRQSRTPSVKRTIPSKQMLKGKRAAHAKRAPKAAAAHPKNEPHARAAQPRHETKTRFKVLLPVLTCLLLGTSFIAIGVFSWWQPSADLRPLAERDPRQLMKLVQQLALGQKGWNRNDVPTELSDICFLASWSAKRGMKEAAAVHELIITRHGQSLPPERAQAIARTYTKLCLERGSFASTIEIWDPIILQRLVAASIFEEWERHCLARKGVYDEQDRTALKVLASAMHAQLTETHVTEQDLPCLSAFLDIYTMCNDHPDSAGIIIDTTRNCLARGVEATVKSELLGMTADALYHGWFSSATTLPWAKKWGRQAIETARDDDSRARWCALYSEVLTAEAQQGFLTEVLQWAKQGVQIARGKSAKLRSHCSLAHAYYMARMYGDAAETIRRIEDEWITPRQRWRFYLYKGIALRNEIGINRAVALQERALPVVPPARRDFCLKATLLLQGSALFGK